MTESVGSMRPSPPHKINVCIQKLINQLFLNMTLSSKQLGLVYFTITGSCLKRLQLLLFEQKRRELNLPLKPADYTLRYTDIYMTFEL